VRVGVQVDASNGSINLLKQSTSTKGVSKMMHGNRKFNLKKIVTRVILFRGIEDQMKGEMVSKAMATIKPLHESILQHKNFKQLAGFSVDSVNKLLKDSHSMQKWNVEGCIRCNIHEAIADVLTLHCGDMRILSLATYSLSILANASETSVEEYVVREGCFTAILETLEKVPFHVNNAT
jgi:hypothetical protein